MTDKDSDPALDCDKHVYDVKMKFKKKLIHRYLRNIEATWQHDHILNPNITGLSNLYLNCVQKSEIHQNEHEISSLLKYF